MVFKAGERIKRHWGKPFGQFVMDVKDEVVIERKMAREKKREEDK